MLDIFLLTNKCLFFFLIIISFAILNIFLLLSFCRCILLCVFFFRHKSATFKHQTALICAIIHNQKGKNYQIALQQWHFHKCNYYTKIHINLFIFFYKNIDCTNHNHISDIQNLFPHQKNRKDLTEQIQIETGEEQIQTFRVCVCVENV